MPDQVPIALRAGTLLASQRSVSIATAPLNHSDSIAIPRIPIRCSTRIGREARALRPTSVVAAGGPTLRL